MSKIITLRKGLDINLQGKAEETLAEAPRSSEYAVSPLDFEGVTPKLLVKVGDKVKAGTPLFFNKYNERVLFTSPVSGTVTAVNRGEKRKVLNVTVAADERTDYEEFARLERRRPRARRLSSCCSSRASGRCSCSVPTASLPTRTTCRRRSSSPHSTPRRWPPTTTSCCR